MILIRLGLSSALVTKFDFRVRMIGAILSFGLDVRLELLGVPPARVM